MKHTPLFAGGQGRSPRDVRESANAFAVYLLLAALLVAVLAVIA